jgi:hypothetical protein
MNDHQAESPKAGPDRSADLSELLEEALKRPGVREVMEVYQSWTRADEVLRQYRRVLAVQRVVSASASSASVL